MLTQRKSAEYIRRMERADGEVKNLNAYIKSRKAVEESKDTNISQLREEVDRLRRCAVREEEIMRSKEATIVSNSRNLEAKEMEINKLKIEMNHLKVKMDALQKDLRDQVWKTEKAQR